LLASHEEAFEESGFDIISHHDSKMGETVAYFGSAKETSALIRAVIAKAEET